MKKSKLENGMIVITREGKVGIVLNDIISGLDWWNPLSFYDDNLKSFRYKFESEPSYNRGGESDIVAVYTVKSLGICLNSLLNKEKLLECGKKYWEESKN